MRKYMAILLAALLLPVAALARHDNNDPEDITAYTEAAKAGDAEAQFKLGTAYQEGDGVHQNDNEASRLFMLAANQNNTDAQAALGFAYRGGFGVSKNLVLSYMWFEIAARQDNEEAQNMRSEVAELMTYDQIMQARKDATTWLSHHVH